MKRDGRIYILYVMFRSFYNHAALLQDTQMRNLKNLVLLSSHRQQLQGKSYEYQTKDEMGRHRLLWDRWGTSWQVSVGTW